MKRYPLFLIAFTFLSILFFSSCLTRKNSVLFKDEPYYNKKLFRGHYPDSLVNAPEDSANASKDVKGIKVQPFDVLDIKIIPSLKAIKELTDNRPITQSAVGGGSSGGGGSGGAGNASYYAGFLVDQEGKVHLPIIGELYVANMTIKEIKETIIGKLDGILSDPFVQVKFLSFRVNVLGGVNSQGQIIITNEKANLIEAISLAGGINEFGDARKIKVIRGIDDPRIYILDLTSVNVMNAKGFKLMPNDVIYVEPNARRYFSANLVTFAGFLTIINTVAVMVALLTR